jgi:hypothetical protein
VRDSKLSFI